MDALRARMLKDRFQKFLSRFVDTLGLDSFADLALITINDLFEIGFKPIYHRRSEQLRSVDASPPVTAPPMKAPPYPQMAS